MNLDHHFPRPRYRATQRERYSAAAALRQQEDSMDIKRSQHYTGDEFPEPSMQQTDPLLRAMVDDGIVSKTRQEWHEYAADRAMKTVPPPAAAADSAEGAAGQDDDRMPPKGAPIPGWIKGIGIAALLVTAAWAVALLLPLVQPIK